LRTTIFEVDFPITFGFQSMGENYVSLKPHQFNLEELFMLEVTTTTLELDQVQFYYCN
jgi:hypothetical protein